jgi:hypothetical protein
MMSGRVGVAIGLLAAVACAACALDSTNDAAGGSASAGTGGVAESGGHGGAGAAAVDASAGSGGASGAAAGAGGTGGGAGGAAGSDSAGASGASGGGGSAGSAPIDCSSFPNAQELTLPGGQKHCYWVVTTPQSFEQARTACQNAQGYLATATSAAENVFIRDLAFATVPSSGRVWLGLSDGLLPNAPCNPTAGYPDYGWITGEPRLYDAWMATACSCNAGCCDHRGVMGSDASWRDRCETEAFPYVCEAGELVTE